MKSGKMGRFCIVCHRRFTGNPVHEGTMVSDELITITPAGPVCIDCHLKGETLL